MEDLELLIKECERIDKNGGVAYILCASREQCFMIRDKANKLGIDIRFPISLEEYRKGGVGMFITDILVYEPEWILKRLLIPNSRNANVFLPNDIRMRDELNV